MAQWAAAATTRADRSHPPAVAAAAAAAADVFEFKLKAVASGHSSKPTDSVDRQIGGLSSRSQWQHAESMQACSYGIPFASASCRILCSQYESRFMPLPTAIATCSRSSVPCESLLIQGARGSAMLGLSSCALVMHIQHEAEGWVVAMLSRTSTASADVHRVPQTASSGKQVPASISSAHWIPSARSTSRWMQLRHLADAAPG